MSRCLITGNTIDPFMSFGKMPIANGFLSPHEFEREHFFDLQIGFEPESQMVQLTQRVDENRMFHDNYPFFSSTSTLMKKHFLEFAETVRTQYIAEDGDPFVVEIGSNDGIMLELFASAGLRHLGIEPSRNVAEVARRKGITTITEFFSEALAKRIVGQYGQADAFLGANVMCHIPYFHSVLDGVRCLLKPSGVLIFEDPYLGDIIQKTAYDQVYDEHVYYFSVNSVSYVAGQHGLEVIDVLPQDVHGGSMRYVVAHQGARPVNESVEKQKAFERSLGLDRIETYLRFKGNVERSRDALLALLSRIRRDNHRVVGYAATSKSTTVTNYCGLTCELIEYISDTTPIKQGKYSPGVHIPVKPYEEFLSDPPEYALLFAWNHSKEVFLKEQPYIDKGGKFIIYVPEVRVV